MRVLVIAILAVLVATSPAAAFERVGDRKILVFAGRQEVPTIDPSIKYDWSIRMAQQSLYDALVKYVGNPPEIVPWLVEKWESSPDAKVWTFHLAKNAKFHNGDPVTAEAVRFSFVRTLKLNQGPAWMLSDFLKEDGIKVVNESTIQFNLTQSYAPFVSFLPWWYVMNPKQVMANEQAGDMGQKWLTTNAAGSGPFKIKRWEQGVLYELEAVDAYWKGWPSKDHIGGVLYKIVRESAAQRAALIRGEADIAEGLSPEDFDQVAKMPGIAVPNFPGMTTFGIKMNTQNGATKDPNLRKAICYAFDYESLVKIYNGNAVLQTSPFPNATRLRGGARDLSPGSRQGERVPGQVRAPERRDRARVRLCPGARGGAQDGARPHRQPPEAQHHREDGPADLAQHGRARRQGRDFARDDGRVHHAGLDRPGRGRVPVPQELVGQVLRLLVLRERRRLGADRQGPDDRAVGGAGADLRRHSAADRR